MGDLTVMIQANHLKKSFGETRALADCSFSCQKGEIHAIIGENGCGKSTLVKILSGILTPDQGELRVNGKNVRFNGPASARKVGVVSIPQEILVVPALSVLDNVVLGQGRFFSGPPRQELVERVRNLLDRLSSEPINLNLPVEELPLSKQQIVVISRGLVLDPEVVILDESTSALDVADRDLLFDFLRERAKAGKSAIYISHRFDEILSLADRLTVIRGGRTIDSLDAKNVQISHILELMSGGSHTDSPHNTKQSIQAFKDEPIVLEARALVMKPNHRPINFQLRRGEIVGLAGLEGHGQETFLEILAGVCNMHISGSVRAASINGNAVEIHSLQGAFRAGMAYVPRDRKTQGLFLKLNIRDNFAMPTYSAVISKKLVDNALAEFQRQLSIVFNSNSRLVGSLSGGNQQKVILARWLSTKPHILLLNDPTRGVDIPTKKDLYRLFEELAAAGVSIVLLSTDLEELINMSNRVLVFREGEIFETLTGEHLRRESLIAGMFGEVV
jgi:ABC-type sugar transport system ATPase subunit